MSSRHGARLGFVAGMAGLGTLVAWLSPDDFIGLGWRFENALLVNKTLGFAIGFILPLLLLALEHVVLACFRFKGTYGAIQGATAIFLLVPFVAIPIHSFFPGGLTASGHAWIFWVLAITFVCWHVMVLGSLLARGHFDNKEDIDARYQNVVLPCVVLASCEVALTVAFLACFPHVFGLTMAEFFLGWV